MARCQPLTSANLAESHRTFQSHLFDSKVAELSKELPPEVVANLKRIAGAGQLHADSRVLDVGCGPGNLIPFIQQQGAEDVLAIDVAPNMLQAVEERFGIAPTQGNTRAVRTWLGDYQDVPSYLGRADVVFMNAVFGNLLDQHAALMKACSLLNPDGRIVISHPLGRQWHRDLHRSNPDMVPNTLPDEGELEGLIKDLPLVLEEMVDEADLYCATLRIPEGFRFQQAPLRLQGPVVLGFQRGSKEMGVPTANIAPLSVEEQLKDCPKGVYFGWAQVQRTDAAGNMPVVKMVMNYGVRPSIKDGSHITVEAHILHEYAEDFYGTELKLLVTGFIRPEMKLASLDALIHRIQLDMAIARAQLDHQFSQPFLKDDWFSGKA